MKTKLKLVTVLAMTGCMGAMVLNLTMTGCDKEKVKGCMDPKSTNYNAEAVEDDGTCQYAKVAPGESTTELLSLKATAGPSIDGVIDAAWADCQKLKTTVAVPDPGGDYFKGYVGSSNNVTLRSMYDATKIYFLVEWTDPTLSDNRQPWYFDPTTKRWKQESGRPTFDAGGVKTRDAFYEDKFAFLWNVNNSIASFNALGCYASCHTGLDKATHFGAPALHYTNSATERMDMWHWKLVRNNPVSQVDDQYQDNAEFGSKDNKPLGGRKTDPKTGGGYNDNYQYLKITGTIDSVKVPKYVIPGKLNYTYILQSEIDASTAKKITAVDANGVLSYSGGTIDPTNDVEFQRKGTGTGTKCFPSVYVAPFVGDRGEITAKGVYTGTGWVLEFSRVLNSVGVAGNYDVKFTPGTDQVFGVAVFENAAIAHAIGPKYTLKFKQ